MTRLVFLVLPLVGLVGAWAGASGGGAVAHGTGLVAGLVAAVALWLVGRDRTRRLSRAVNAWMGKVDVQPVEVGGGPDDRELATAINTLGAAYARRGRRLEEAGPRVAELVAALPEPAVLFTAQGTVAQLNGPARELLGAAEEPGLGATQALGSTVLVALVEDVIAGRAAGGEQREALLGRRVVSARATSFAGHVLLLVRDLTDARRVAAVRRDFVTNASHELKTPVAGIQSLADALEVVLDSDPTRARSLLERLRGEAGRLTTLVGDLLSLRRVDEDPEADALEDVPLEPVAAAVLAGASLAADERGVELELDVADGLAVRVVPEDLRLLLANLVDNAVKYNREDGRVTVTAARVGEQVRLEVTDTGIGIPAKDVERVFERFYRVDPGRSRDAGGTGLGLAIVRHAAERNGGTVEVRSLVRRGTTFTVWLPAAGADGLAEPGDDGPPA